MFVQLYVWLKKEPTRLKLVHGYCYLCITDKKTVTILFNVV